MRTLAILVTSLTVLLVAATSIDSKEPTKRELRNLNVAAKLLASNKPQLRQQGIEKIIAFVKRYPSDQRTPKAKQLLRKNGVGDGIRVELIDREVITEGLGYTDELMLQMGEGAIRELLPYYASYEPFYKDHSVKLVFYDSQARYRKETKQIYSGGDFSVEKSSDKTRSLEGEVAWFFPALAGSKSDRETRTKSMLYHEMTHYLNAVYFARMLPSIMNEGLAKWTESRHNKTYYQANRRTAREEIESDARHGLGMIAKYPDFLKFLDARRGFDRADSSLNRWYGLCYSIVDFFERGEVNSRRAALPELFKHLYRKTTEFKEKSKKPVGMLSNKALLEDLVTVFYGVDLKTFHEALTAHILTYRQR